VIDYAWLVPFFPLLGALIAAVFARQLRGQAHLPVAAGIGLAFLVSLGLLGSVGEGGGRTVVSPWIDIAGLAVPIEFRLDGLSAMMISMVTFVATLIAIYASGYMGGDPAYPRFFAFVGLFVFSMTGLVLSNNYVLTYAFWEGVGVCSYMLVGFWHAKPAAAAAAKKAFLVNRVGDVGFAIAIFWMWSAFDHRTDYDYIFGHVGELPRETILGIALLLFWAATAKSAQVPLYVWLPDAMEGPTPVSALIHAATMVTAGVYLIARSTPLVVLAPTAQLIVAIVGCVTALLAAAIAVTQTDLKRVMAYSTVSQLGYMFMGLGSGIGDVAQLAVVAAMFHLFTHAFFKALLFLASGSVMHSMGGIIDMRRFGGLRHRMPITCWTFAAGGLALAGFPLTAGFFSKDEILAALGHASHSAGPAGHSGWGWIYGAIYWTAVLTSLMTAFYTGRAFFLTFFGPEKLPSPDDPEAAEEPADAHSPTALTADPHRPADLPAPTPGATDEPVPQDHGHGHGHDHGHGHGHGGHAIGHESPLVMTVPLMILAFFALLAGLIFGLTGWFEHLLARTPGFEVLGHPSGGYRTDWASIAIGSLAGIAGLALSWYFYGTRSPIPGQLARSLRPLYDASYHKFYVDEFYDWTVIKPTRWLAAISGFLDDKLVHGSVVRTALFPRWVGRHALAPFQNGLIQFYAAVTALGVAALLVILLLI
jgi:NADH-quinone oxidoreductase subunit L